MSLPENVTVRQATLSDLDAIVALWLEMMRDHERFDRRVRLAPSANEAYLHYARYYLSRSDAAVFVAQHEDDIIGFCLAYRAQNLPMFLPPFYGFVSDLAVHEAWRGRGIGTALLAEAQRRLRQFGVTHIQLQVYDRNTSGMTFWRQAGFGDFVHGLWFGLKE